MFCWVLAVAFMVMADARRMHGDKAATLGLSILCVIMLVASLIFS